jgi:large subunit ribosomal protein L29
MKYKDVKGMSVEELKKKVTQLQDDLFQMKMKNLMGQQTNPLLIRGTRRGIARIRTALTQKLAQ